LTFKRGDTGRYGPPSLFRTYRYLHGAAPDCEIWEAARATCAAPGFFKPIILEADGLPECDYIGGRIGFNNPCARLLFEAGELFKRRPIACLINIGNGLPSKFDWGRNLHSRRRFPGDLFNAVVDNFHEPRAMGFTLKDSYFRFNVPRDLFDLSRWYQDEAVRTVVDTVAYLEQEDVQQALDCAVELVSAPTKPLSKQPGDV
jgi:hypothetical protein